MFDMRLKNKVAIITGASGGIGSAAVKLFADEGAKVLAVDRNEDLLRATIASFETSQAAYFVADVTQEAEVETPDLAGLISSC